MIIRVGVASFIKARSGGNVDFTADDRLNSCTLAGFIEFHHSIHVSVVGDGYGILVTFLDPVGNACNTARAVKSAIFTVEMKMNKFSHLRCAFLCFLIYISFRFLANSVILESLWFNPDFEMGGVCISASSERLRDGFSIRSLAVI